MAVWAALAAETTWAGRWFFPPEPIRWLFIYGPMIGLAWVLAESLSAQRSGGFPPSALIGGAAIGAAALGALVWRTLEAETGLWREWTALDSHFSNQIIRGYYFPPALGLTGLAATALCHGAVAGLLRRGRAYRRAALATAALLLGVLTLFGTHQFLPKPYFVG